MSQTKAYHTPSKPNNQNLNVLQTADFTPQQNSLSSDNRVDYKAKTFKLMKQLAQSQVLNKKYQTHIRHLQQQGQALRKQLQRMFRLFKVNSFEQAYKKIELVMQSDRRLGNDCKVQEWTNIIEQYKRIINTQQYKFIKLEQQFKISEVKLKRYEQDKQQNSKHKSDKAEENGNAKNQENKKLKAQIANKQLQNKSLEEEVAILKTEYKKAIIQKDQVKDSLEQLKIKYTQEIQHFEEMQKHVEERLIEVEKQMTYYRQERQEHMEKISLMKKQIQLHQMKAYFSFGGVGTSETQTDFQQEQSSQFNNECLQISIKTLLQENDRLKNTLMLLYTKRGEIQLPKQVELELKILMNMRDTHFKYEQQQPISIKANIQIDKSIEKQQGPQDRIEIARIPETIVEQENQEEEQDKHKEQVGMEES